MNQITGVIITLNEAQNIAECIASLQTVCNEIIVVDSGSQDQTREIAESCGARVFVQSYLGDGPQKNYGLQFATNDWILSLDADERLTPELIAEINQLNLNETQSDGFAARRRNYIGSRWIKRCGWYPDYCTRLYNRQKTRFKDVKQHSFVDAQAPPRHRRALCAAFAPARPQRVITSYSIHYTKLYEIPPGRGRWRRAGNRSWPPPRRGGAAARHPRGRCGRHPRR